MIELTCIKCEAPMQVDDAFAGSTCRCRQCGTIQTVPKLRRNTEPARAAKSLYTNLKRSGQGSSGLDALADVVASSGLSSGLPLSDESAPATAKPSRLPLITAAVGGIVGIMATVVIMIILSRSNDSGAPSANPSVSIANAAASGEINFCGINIDAPSVVFVLDRGNSTRDAMGHLVNAVAATIRKTGSDRKFQVVFWDNGQAELSYPPGGPQFATPEAVNGAIRMLESVVAFGRTEAGPAVKKALATRPQVMVLVTAKGTELGQPFFDEIMAEEKSAGGTTRIHTISIGESGEWLKKVAEATDAEHKQLSLRELRDAAD